MISGRLTLIGGEGEVLEQVRVCAHPCMDELLLEMAGEGLPTCIGDLQRWMWQNLLNYRAHMHLSLSNDL